MERNKLQSMELNKYNTGIFDTKVNVDDEDEDALIMPDQKCTLDCRSRRCATVSLRLIDRVERLVKVYRAGKGIIKFQQSMDRLANEE
jgi:hypothetical protein